MRLTKVPSLDLYREPDPFRIPWPSEIKTRIDLLELLTTWTAGFPEPQDVQPARRAAAGRAPRRLRRRPRQPVPGHRAAEDRRPRVCRWSRPCTTRSPATACSTSAAAPGGASRWCAGGTGSPRCRRRSPARSRAADRLVDVGSRHRRGLRASPPDQLHVVPLGVDTELFKPAERPGPQPDHRDRQRRRAAQGRQPPAARGRAAARRARPRAAARRQARTQRPDREAHRRAGHLRHRAQLQRAVRLRAGRPAGVGRSRLHPFAVRGVLAARRRGDGQRHPDRREPRRRAARGGRRRRRVRPAGPARPTSTS